MNEIYVIVEMTHLHPVFFAFQKGDVDKFCVDYIVKEFDEEYQEEIINEYFETGDMPEDTYKIYKIPHVPH